MEGKELSDYIKEQVRLAIEEHNFTPQKNTNQHMDDSYGKIRTKYTKLIRASAKERGHVSHPWKIIEAIRDIAKADTGVSYMNKATDEELNQMAVVYERVAKAYLAQDAVDEIKEESGDSN